MKKFQKAAIALSAFGAGLIGCTEEHGFSEPPSYVATTNGAVVAARPTAIRHEEQPFERIAAMVPSFAGYYIDQAGSLVIMVADEHDDNRAMAAARRVVNEDALLSRANYKFKIGRARRSFRQLATARDLVFDSVFSLIPDVRTLDLDEKDNRVRIGIDEVSYSNVKQLLTQRFRVLGIDTTLIRLVSEQIARPTSTASLRNRDTPAATSLTAMWGAMVGGILIQTTGADPKAGGASPASCSAGFAANHTPAGSPTYRAIVTATHCTTVWGARMVRASAKAASSAASRKLIPISIDAATTGAVHPMLHCSSWMLRCRRKWD